MASEERLKLVKFYINKEESEMVEQLKTTFNTTTRSKVFRESLKKTYELFTLTKVK